MRGSEDAHRLAKISFSMFEERDKRTDNLRLLQNKNHDTLQGEVHALSTEMKTELVTTQAAISQANQNSERADASVRKLQDSFNRQYNLLFKEQNQRHRADLNYQQKADQRFRDIDNLMVRVEQFQEPLKQVQAKIEGLADLQWHVERTLPPLVNR